MNLPTKIQEALRRRGHFIGSSAVSHDGFLLLNVDNRMMKVEDAAKLLLEKETVSEESEANIAS